MRKKKTGRANALACCHLRRRRHRKGRIVVAAGRRANIRFALARATIRLFGQIARAHTNLRIAATLATHTSANDEDKRKK